MPLRTCDPIVQESPAGWMAVTPPEYPLHIGVTGGDAEEARERFAEALEAWRELDARAHAGAGAGTVAG